MKRVFVCPRCKDPLMILDDFLHCPNCSLTFDEPKEIDEWISEEESDN